MDGEKTEGGEMKIGILIPTLNRPDYLIRVLEYYNKLKFDGIIYIADSSTSENAEKIKKCIEGLSIDVDYFYYSQNTYPHDGACIKEILEHVSTPYCAFSGDDDFFVPSSLRKCAEFLESNPDYSAAHGFRLNFYMEDRILTGGFLTKGHEIETDQVGRRWQEYMRNGISTQHYVHRLETWKKMYENADLPSRYLAPELLPCGITAIEGKIKFIDCLHIAFDKSSEKQGMDFDKVSYFDLMNKPEWSKTYKGMRKNIVSALAGKGLNKETAESIFLQEMWSHSTSVMAAQYNLKYSQQKPVPPNELNTLRTPSFRHYSDFRQIEIALGAV